MRRFGGAVLVTAGCAASAPAPVPTPIAIAPAPSIPVSASATASASAAPSASAAKPAELRYYPPEEPEPADLSSPEVKQHLSVAKVKNGDLKVGALAVPGPCWKPIEHARVMTGLVDVPGIPLADLKWDLDGDGTKDAVLDMGAASITSTYELYLRRGTCGYWIGALATDANLSPTKDKTNGLFDLEGEVRCRHGCCDRVRVRYAFDGKRYVLAKHSIEKTDCGF
jgi:hypothetical protein